MDGVGETEARRTHPKAGVAVTGVVGRLGRRLVRGLHRQGRVVGFDQRPFPDRPKDVEHHQIDVRRRKTRELFRQSRVGALVHLGIVHNPPSSGPDHHADHLLGYERLLECVTEFGVSKLVLVSSAMVYGSRHDNPQFFDEDAPLLGADASEQLRDLVTLDMRTQSFFWKRSDVETVILRPCHVLGSSDNVASSYLRLPVVPTLMGFDPMIQVVHEDDLVTAIRLALRPGVRGIFNIGGCPPLPLSRALRLLERATVPVPHLVARVGVAGLGRRLGLAPNQLDFIRYVCMVDDSRARELLSYRPRHAIARTLAAVDAERWV